MRILPWALLILAILAVGWLARDARHRLHAMRAEVAVMEAARDSALAVVDAAVARADSAAALADSLEAIRVREVAEAQARARWLAREADSLSDAIAAMVPEGEVRNAVVEAVAGLRATYETRIADLEGIVARSDEEIVTLRAERVELRASITGCRGALTITTEQRDLCMAGKDPGLWQRIKDAAVLVVGTAVTTAVVVLVVG